MGLTFEPDVTVERIKKLAEICAEKKLFFRIDIEDSTTTDQTFKIYREEKVGFWPIWICTILG